MRMTGFWSCTVSNLIQYQHHRHPLHDSELSQLSPALPPRRDDAALVPAEPQPQIQERPDDEREEEALAIPAYEEFEAHGRAALAPVKPNYNLRRVLERLPKLVDSGDVTTAKRLLVGLPERLWHTPAGDFCNLLRRAGLPQPVITLAAEAVSKLRGVPKVCQIAKSSTSTSWRCNHLQRDGSVRLVPPGRRHIHDPAG